jgi:hypothetical protein
MANLPSQLCSSVPYLQKKHAVVAQQSLSANLSGVHGDRAFFENRRIGRQPEIPLLGETAK